MFWIYSMQHYIKEYLTDFYLDKITDIDAHVDMQQILQTCKQQNLISDYQIQLIRQWCTGYVINDEYSFTCALNAIAEISGYTNEHFVQRLKDKNRAVGILNTLDIHHFDIYRSTGNDLDG